MTMTFFIIRPDNEMSFFFDDFRDFVRFDNVHFSKICMDLATTFRLNVRGPKIDLIHTRQHHVFSSI
jgi:hypothetical protein